MNKKYTEGMPLYRLEQQFERQGISLSLLVLVVATTCSEQRHVEVVRVSKRDMQKFQRATNPVLSSVACDT